MRIPIPVTMIDCPTTLRKRWDFWLRIPEQTADALSQKERHLHQAYVDSRQERLVQSWLYPDENDVR